MERSTSRLKVLAILVAFMFAALMTRLWFLQVLAPASAVESIDRQSARFVDKDATRGRIYDDRHQPLVLNRISLEVRVTKDQLDEDAEGELLRLSEVLGIPVQEIRKGLDNPDYYDYQSKPVAYDVDKNISFYLSEHADEFPGVDVVPAAVRDYPNGTLAAHALGWVGQINSEEIADTKRYKNYGVNDLVGKTGLEKQYESFLRGRKGRQKYLVNSNQEIVRLLGEQTAVPGDDLVLSLNIHTQQIAEQALSDGIAHTRTIFDESQAPPGYLKANSGAVIVMDPTTGGIKALASWPTFDPSWFVQSLSKKKIATLFGDHSGAPTLDRATQLSFAPGSTFKPFIALAAQQNGIANFGSYYPCPPEYVYPGDTTTVFHNWTTANLGTISVERALQISCDTVFYQFGADFYDRYKVDPLGPDATLLQKGLQQFGFGTATRLDLPLETTGLIPDPTWKEQFAADHPEVLLPEERSWLPGDDIQMAIGQGFVTVTPMQLAVAYSAIANGGKICRPHVVDHIVDPNGDTVQTVSGHCNKRTLPYTQTELDYVMNALALVTQPGGTASTAFAGFPLSEVPVAGKTGTAQRPPFQDTSWFAAMVPASNPQYVIIAMVEQGGHGSTSAALIARQVIEGLYGIDSAGVIDGGSTD
ncbi:MAG: penicillin-binding protein 2 [Actinomycetota bacterium]